MVRPKRKLAGCRVLITGASSGIGQSLALELARNGAKMLLTARRKERLEELAKDIHHIGGIAFLVAGDVTSHDVQQELIDSAARELGGLDVLVNNAGVGGIGSYASASPNRLRQIMEVNFFATAELIRYALPLLRASPDPAIVNIGSVLGHCAVPGKSEYCASKFAVHGLSDALRIELAEEGIDVILVSPSTTASEFFSHAMKSDGRVAQNRRSMSPEAVAGHITRAIVHRRREIILSPGGKLLVWADRLFPGWTSHLLTRYG